MNLAAWVGLLIGTLQAPQDPDEQEIKVKFQFKDAPIEDVIEYVKRVTGYVIEDQADVSGSKITAWSESEIPRSHVLAFLDSALHPKYALVQMDKKLVKIYKYEDAKKRTLDVRVTHDPLDVPRTDQVLTVIYPLQNLNVVEVNKELDDLYPRTATVLLNTYSNTLIITGRGDEIHKLMVVLSKLDVEAKEQLILKVITLKNADATTTAKLINDLFIKEAEEQRNSFTGFLGRMMRGGSSRGPGGVEAKDVASEIIRVVPDVRTNSLIIASTATNIQLIEEVVRKLDEVSGSVKVKAYSLFYADAESAAKLINDLFSPKNNRDNQPSQTSRTRMDLWGRSRSGGQSQQAQAPPVDLKAVADLRTNTVIVTASEKQLEVVDGLMEELDKESNDRMVVRVFRLRNADALDTASQIEAMFDGTTGTPVSSGAPAGGGYRGGPQQGGRGGQRQPGATQSTLVANLPPSQQIDVVADIRTNSIIVKAAPPQMEVIDEMVRQLDLQESEGDKIFTYRPRNMDAVAMAMLLKSLTGTGTQQQQQQPFTNPFSQYQRGGNSRTQGYGNNQGGFNNNSGSGSSRFGSSSRGSGSGFGGFSGFR